MYKFKLTSGIHMPVISPLGIANTIVICLGSEFPYFHCGGPKSCYCTQPLPYKSPYTGHA